LIDAEKNGGIPKALLEDKKNEIKKRLEENARIQQGIQSSNQRDGYGLSVKKEEESNGSVNQSTNTNAKNAWDALDDSDDDNANNGRKESRENKKDDRDDKR
jgi:hypothetical protein